MKPDYDFTILRGGLVIDNDFQSSITSRLQKELSDKQELNLKAVFDAAGLDTSNPEVLSTQVKFVQIEGDEFEHYCLMDGTKLISVKRTPDISWSDKDGTVTVNADVPYIVHYVK